METKAKFHEEYLIPIGSADIKKSGSDVTIVSFGKIMKVAFGRSPGIRERRNLC